ncbi:MAG: aminotransferase class IV family protein [Armatimonadota bacterium]|nr:MAG: aminotransferase class IV family protein [Armatimonadota bacterium]
MKNLVWMNGEFVPADRACVALLDRGYLYGEGLFETMRSYGGRIFALERHLGRLLSSAAEFGLDIGVGEEELAESLARTLQANDLSDAYLRLTVSQQCDAPGIESRAAGRFTISIIARPLTASHRGDANGVSAIVLAAGTAPPVSLARHKTLSFLAYVRARAAARVGAADDALLANAVGEITEASTANVFFAMRGRLVTPAIECGLLPGVTRAVVLELARAAGIDTAEEAVRPTEFPACEECFLTNSLVELQPVTRINGRPVGDETPGPVWSALAASYRRLAACASET